MPIFSKRTLQRLINENSRFLTKEQLLKHINGLNKSNEDSINFEWEVVLLNAFNKLGKLSHEPTLAGKRRLDLLFGHSTGTELLADIATVSDRGFEAENPLEPFLSELTRMRNKYGLKQGSFSWKIEGQREGPFRDQKMKLNLPPRREIHKVFDGGFHQFMKKIKLTPILPRSLIIRTSDANISINYNPGGKYSSGSYPAYTVAYSITRNPVYNALKRKSNQLKQSGYRGYRAILLCDGGCHLFRDKLYSPDTFRMSDIICKFLRDTSSIDLILTFSIQSRLKPFYSGTELYSEIQFFTNSGTLTTFADQLSNELKSLIPKPVLDATNGVNHLKGKHRKEGLSHYGGWQMSGNTIRISARALLDLLAGRVSQKKFFEDHKLTPTETHKDAVNYFERSLKQGRLIDGIKLERSIDEDDDWIVIQFGNPDPAIARLVLPKTSVS
jgi:hypothetical protein